MNATQAAIRALHSTVVLLKGEVRKKPESPGPLYILL